VYFLHFKTWVDLPHYKEAALWAFYKSPMLHDLVLLLRRIYRPETPLILLSN
jgi:hypothetical protein